ncbi:hypothetical protein Tco_1226395 [Tanacetum coccineum]
MLSTMSVGFQQCALQTLSLKQQSDYLRQQSGFTDKKHRKFKVERVAKEAIATEKAKVDEELEKAKSQLESQEIELKELKEARSYVTTFFQSDFESLVRRFLKNGEFNRAFRDVISLDMSVGVEQGLRMARTDTEFQELSQKISNFVPNAQEKFDDVLEPDLVVPSSKAPSTTMSLGVGTHDRSSTPSAGTFGRTSTPKHLKRKKPSRSGASSAVNKKELETKLAAEGMLALQGSRIRMQLTLALQECLLISQRKRDEVLRKRNQTLTALATQPKHKLSELKETKTNDAVIDNKRLNFNEREPTVKLDAIVSLHSFGGCHLCFNFHDMPESRLNKSLSSACLLDYFIWQLIKVAAMTEADGYPTILFYPAGNKSSEPVNSGYQRHIVSIASMKWVVPETLTSQEITSKSRQGKETRRTTTQATSASIGDNLKFLEEELKNTKERLDESENERNRVVVDLHKTKELANAGLSPTKVVHEQLENLQRGNRNGSIPSQSSVARRGVGAGLTGTEMAKRT